MIDWIKNIFSSNDLKDLNGEGTASDKELEKIIGKHKSKSKDKLSRAFSAIKNGLEEQKKRREDALEAKSESYGETTTEGIAKARRKKMIGWAWRGLGVTLLMIILTAFYRVVTGDVPASPVPEETEKILDGIDTEDADYFQSRTSALISQLAGEVKKLREENEEKDAAAREALLVEAKKSEKLQEEIDALKTQTKEREMNQTQKDDILALVNDKFEALKETFTSDSSRPTPGVASHKIKPLPRAGSNEQDILVDPQTPMAQEPLTPEEEVELKEKVKEGSEALRQQQIYEDITITTLEVDGSIQDAQLDSDAEKEQPPLHIMTGFAKGILITGVDAPTFSAGQSNPVPIVISLNTNEVIANGYDADIRDCMLIGQAFGNMNTIRAEIEVTRISCNVEIDGQMHKIEDNVKGWVYDENGIHGLQGRLVDSSGKLITRELSVGFLEGVATAFSTPNTTIQPVQGMTSQIFENNSLKDASYRGLASGTNTALSGLAEYYKKLLDGAYPFVSVRAGRPITVLFKGGESIKLTEYTRIDVNRDKDAYNEEESMEIDDYGW